MQVEMQKAFPMHVGKPFRDTTRDAVMGSIGTSRLRLEKLLQAAIKQRHDNCSQRSRSTGIHHRHEARLVTATEVPHDIDFLARANFFPQLDSDQVFLHGSDAPSCIHDVVFAFVQFPHDVVPSNRMLAICLGLATSQTRQPTNAFNEVGLAAASDAELSENFRNNN